MSGVPVTDLSSVGALLHIGGSLLIVLGQTTVKIAHCIKASSGLAPSWLVSQALRPHWQRPDGQWKRLLLGSKVYTLFGWSLFALGNALRFVSMRFASQTVLSGLGSLQFVLIPVVSYTLLGIGADQSTVLGVIIVMLGNVLIVYYGPGDKEYTMMELRWLWQSPNMHLFLAIMFVTLIILQLVWWELRAAAKAQRLTAPFSMLPERRAVVTPSNSVDDHFEEFTLGFTLPFSGAWITADAAQVFTGALLYSAIASVIGAWSVLFSKSLTYVVSALPESASDPYSWVVLVLFFGTAAFWIRQSNQGLRLYPASLIMPLMQAFWMCMSVLEGGIYFQELSHLSTSTRWLLWLGLTLALIGAIFMGVAGFVAERRLAMHMPVSPPVGLKSAMGPLEDGTLDGEVASSPSRLAAVGVGEEGVAEALSLDASRPVVRAETGMAAVSLRLPGRGSDQSNLLRSTYTVPQPRLPRSGTPLNLDSPPAHEPLQIEWESGALSPHFDGVRSPRSPSSIREVVLDSQRLLRSGAGGLLHRVTQAFQ